MKRNLLFFAYFTVSLILATSCGNNAKLYRFPNNSKAYAGQLSDADFVVLKQILTKSSPQQVKDTIMIKYEYNHETCWDILDQSDKGHIMGFVAKHQERVQHVLATRPHASVYDFREPGNNLNKLKKWNNAIIIDSTKQLFNLLFKERCTCGNSIIIMPDKRYVFLRSDAHSLLLDLTQNEIENILNKQ